VCSLSSAAISAEFTPATQKGKKFHCAGAAVQSHGNSYYIVKKRDTLSHIAAAHGTTVESLKSINHLRTTRLQIGQKLALKEFAINPRNASTKMQAVAARLTEKTRAEGAPGKLQAPVMATNADTEDSLAGWLPVLPPETDENGESVNQPLRFRLATMGLNFLGVRYKRSGASEASGFDCSGLVKTLFDKFDITLPRTSREQYQLGEKVSKEDLEVGDLVFFSSRGKTPSHVAIYIGDNMILHAALKARRVLVSSLDGSWYTKHFLGARRLFDLWKDEPPPEEPNQK
jgi:cell wall-associated NlpC family hydrolase